MTADDDIKSKSDLIGLTKVIFILFIYLFFLMQVASLSWHFFVC